MREEKVFGKRTKVWDSAQDRKRYFLVYEGKNTERLYFAAVAELRKELKLNPLIELVPVIRSYNEEGWSNPKKMIDRIIQNLEEGESGKVSYETLLNWIIDYFQDEKIIAKDRVSAKYIWIMMEDICNNELNVNLYAYTQDARSACEKIISVLGKKINMDNLIENVEQIITYSNLTYANGFDKICFIVDRDRKSFSAEQYKYVNEQCKNRGFGLYLTNPCFEFWLLMHFRDVTELDEKQLLENPLVTSKRRYTEQELRKRLPGYEKSKYNAIQLVKNLDLAIANEKKFCEEIEQLENEIGSNVGLLLCEMRK